MSSKETGGSGARQKKRTAVEMAASVGSSVVLPDQFWQDFSRLDLSTVLRDLGKELGFSWLEWAAIINGAGMWLVESLDKAAANLQAQVVEQQTAIELRQTFGVPHSDLALPVFMELAVMEADARQALQQGAASVEAMWARLREQVFYTIQLFLANRINQVEEEERANKQALMVAKEHAKGHEQVLAPERTAVDARFKQTLRDLSTKKDELMQAFRQLTGGAVRGVERALEATVFQASRQSLAVTQVG